MKKLQVALLMSASTNVFAQAIKTSLEKEGLDVVFTTSQGVSVEQKPHSVFDPDPTIVYPQMSVNDAYYGNYKDGQTSRRERRQKQRNGNRR